MDLVPLRGSGITGTVVLQPRVDGQVAVQVRPNGLTTGTGYYATVHAAGSGNCAGTAIANGLAGAAARATVGYGTVTAGPVDRVAAVSIDEGQPPPSATSARACADVAGVIATALPATGSGGLLPRQAGSDGRSAAVALVAAGFIAAGVLRVRRRAT